MARIKNTPVLASLEKRIDAQVVLLRMYRGFVCSDQKHQDQIQNKIKILWINACDEQMLLKISRLAKQLKESKNVMETALQNVRMTNQIIENMKNTSGSTAPTREIARSVVRKMIAKKVVVKAKKSRE
jgi:uncharacterized membrane protein